MPRVPIASPEIRPQVTPEVAAPPLVRPTEAAFGGEVAQAGEHQGQVVQQSADTIMQRMFEHRERENAQQNLDVQTQFQKDLQSRLINPELDDNQTPKGFLNRQLNQAKGATAAFDQQAMELKQRYMGMVGSPLQKQDMNRILSTHLVSAREQIVAHEAQQTQAAFDNSFQANMKTTVANAAGISDPVMLSKYISTAQLSSEAGWKHSGLAPDATEAARKGLAGEIVKSALIPLAESDPKKAQEVLDSAKAHLTPEAFAEMQNVVNAKKVFQVVQGATDWAKTNARQADGYINLEPVMAHLKTMGLNPKQEYEAGQDIRRNVWMDTSEVQKQFDTNMRQATLNMLDDKMSGSEAQRLFTTGQINRQDFEALNRKLQIPETGALRSFMVSDPQTFNEIRQAQLTGSKSPAEIQRMIAGSPGITPDDGKYLMKMNSENPPTDRDKYIEAQANNLRDFGSRYFAETNFLGMKTNEDKTSKEAHSMVANYYSAVDKAQAKGEDIDKIRDQVLKTALNDRFPGVGKLEKMPDIVIDVKGRVTRLLAPDEHSGLKPKYRIMPVGTGDKEDQ
jgi:hypothetical protein